MGGIRRAGLVAVALSMLLCACNKPLPDHQDDTTKRDRQQVEGIDLSVRLRVAETRIAKLERQVLELQATPSSVEADLLRQRLSVTEAALADAARANAEVLPPVPQPAPTPSYPKSTSGSGARTDPASPPSRSTSKLPTATPRLRLVDPKTFEMTR